MERSGLFKAVNGNVLIYVHKEQEFDDVAQRFPADHYVMVDDKLRILAAIKTIWGLWVTTVSVRQGRYALDPKNLPGSCREHRAYWRFVELRPATLYTRSC